MFNKNKKIQSSLEYIDTKINHIQDMVADNRVLLVKLIKQNNQVVNFLKELEADVDEQNNINAPPSFGDTISEEKMLELKTMLDEFRTKNEELKDFEDELEKHKDELTPGQVGES